MTADLQTRLNWVLANQPRNVVAINGLRAQLGLPPAPQAPKPKKAVPTPKKPSKGQTLYPFSKGYIQRQMRNVTIHY